MTNISKPFHFSRFEPDIQQRLNVNFDELVNYLNDRNSGTVAWDNVVSVNPLGMKNRIINGDMLIDQRNAGAAVTINTTAAAYTLDRFLAYGQAADGVFTIQQSTTVFPPGHSTSLKATVTTADSSIGAGQYYLVGQRIEGYNIYDIGFGTSWAKQITLSFWVRSSVTGTFGGSIRNDGASRSYPFTYAISVADTWEQKTVTLTADTTGTWLTTSGIGLELLFSLGNGSTYKGTAGAWSANNYTGATGETALISTLNATWYITGIQVELGAVATAFEWRSFGTEMALCQRYYEKSYDYASIPGSTDGLGQVWGTRASGSWACYTPFKVSKRGTPTITSYNPSTGASGRIRNGNTAASEVSSPANIGINGFQNVGTGATVGEIYHWQFTAESEP